LGKNVIAAAIGISIAFVLALIVFGPPSWL